MANFSDDEYSSDTDDIQEDSDDEEYIDNLMLQKYYVYLLNLCQIILNFLSYFIEKFEYSTKFSRIIAN